MEYPTPSDDVIDSRNVIEAIEELESLQEDGPLSEEDAATLASLRALAAECENDIADWRYGESLIREDYFETYARDLAEDLYGKEISEAKWPFSCIDWERAASELQQDYTSYTWEGVTYYAR